MGEVCLVGAFYIDNLADRQKGEEWHRLVQTVESVYTTNSIC